jgi:hypothetical protein
MGTNRKDAKSAEYAKSYLGLVLNRRGAETQRTNRKGLGVPASLR